jgi:lipopolysaccharide transport system permease protein
MPLSDNELTMATPNSVSETAPPWRLIYLRDLLYELVMRDVKLRYKRSVLGVGWSLLAALAQLLILQFVFSRVVPLSIPHYTTFLFSGLLPWTWFQSSLMLATGATLDNRELVRLVRFPVWILPIITVTSQFIHLLLALPLLLIFLWFDRSPLSTSMLALPLVFGVQFLLTVSIAYFVAPLQAIFHDTEHLLGILLTFSFYLTPVFYNLNALPERTRTLFMVNPFTHLLTAYRQILLQGAWPSPLPLLIVAVLSTVLLACGYRFYLGLHYRFAQEL